MQKLARSCVRAARGLRRKDDADGTDRAEQKLARVLTTDPGMGVLRHVDAGYDDAIAAADEHGLRVPMRAN